MFGIFRRSDQILLEVEMETFHGGSILIPSWLG